MSLPDSHSNLSTDDRPSSLIEAMVEDLTPVQVARSWRSALLLWAGLSWVFVTSAVLVAGPLREGALTALAASPRTGLEFALGLGAGLTAIWAGLEIGVPGTPSQRRLWIPPLILMSGWLGIVLYDLTNPALGISMSGKREHCYIQSLVFATPPYFLALWLVRERVPRFHAGAFAGLLIGAAAAAIPSLLMQLACMHDPAHALHYHLTPVLTVGVIGALVGHFALKR